MLDQTEVLRMIPVICMTLTQLIVFAVIVGVLQSSSIIFVSVGIFVGSLLCFCLLGRSTSHWPRRQDVWSVARWTCIWIWTASVIGYGFYFFSFPDAFSFSAQQLWFIAPMISLAPAIISLILTMCAGDSALFILGREDR